MKSIIRTMSLEDVKLSLTWAQNEGWNPGRQDVQPFYSSDPNGFFINTLDEKPIATISAVAYESHFGFIGLYIVHPNYRKCGYGLATWNHGMKYLEGRNIGLDGVVAQQENYKKSGFQLAYRNIRYEGTIANSQIEQNKSVLPLHHFDFSDIEKFDQRCFPSRRTAFLKKWIAMPNSFSYGFQESGNLKGWGLIRSCFNGYKIGPLFAEDPTIAQAIFSALMSHGTTGNKIYLDISEQHAKAAELVQHYKMQPMFETARMYTGPEPQIEKNCIYGVTTFELG